VGAFTLREDTERVRAVREAIDHDLLAHHRERWLTVPG